MVVYKPCTFGRTYVIQIPSSDLLLEGFGNSTYYIMKYVAPGNVVICLGSHNDSMKDMIHNWAQELIKLGRHDEFGACNQLPVNFLLADR